MTLEVTLDVIAESDLRTSHKRQHPLRAAQPSAPFCSGNRAVPTDPTETVRQRNSGTRGTGPNLGPSATQTAGLASCSRFRNHRCSKHRIPDRFRLRLLRAAYQGHQVPHRRTSITTDPADSAGQERDPRSAGRHGGTFDRAGRHGGSSSTVDGGVSAAAGFLGRRRERGRECPASKVFASTSRTTLELTLRGFPPRPRCTCTWAPCLPRLYPRRCELSFFERFPALRRVPFPQGCAHSPCLSSLDHTSLSRPCADARSAAPGPCYSRTLVRQC